MSLRTWSRPLKLPKHSLTSRVTLLLRDLKVIITIQVSRSSTVLDYRAAFFPVILRSSWLTKACRLEITYGQNIFFFFHTKPLPAQKVNQSHSSSLLTLLTSPSPEVWCRAVLSLSSLCIHRSHGGSRRHQHSCRQRRYYRHLVSVAISIDPLLLRVLFAHSFIDSLVGSEFKNFTDRAWHKL